MTAGAQAAALCGQALRLRQEGRGGEADARYRHVLKLARLIGRDDLQGLLALGAAHVGLGHLDEAIRHYAALLDRLPAAAEAARAQLAATIASLRETQSRATVEEGRRLEDEGSHAAAARAYASIAPASEQGSYYLRRLLSQAPEAASGIAEADRARTGDLVARGLAMAALTRHVGDFERHWRTLSFDRDHLQLITDLTYRSDDVAHFARVSMRLGADYAERAAPIVASRGWLPPAPPPAADGRIRVSWLCVDFAPGQIVWESLTAYFRGHDRNRFRLFVHATNAEARRIAPQLESWGVVYRDLAGLDDADVAAAIRADDIDILADINGYHPDSKPLVLALRPAPLQLLVQSYLRPVYSRFHDFQLTDRHLIPRPVSPYERLVWMSGPCTTPWRRDEFHPGLPGEPLPPFPVRFLAPHQLNKIDAGLCGLWLDILERVPAATLTVRAEAAAFVRRHAAARGLAERIVVQPRLPDRLVYLEYLASHHLMVDSMPFSGSATGVDCLAVGVPVLSCETPSPMSRIMGDLLVGCGLGHMVCRDRDTYRQTAIALGTDPARLAAERKLLADKHATLALFDGGRVIANWERAFAVLHERRLAGLPPDHIDLEAPA